MNHIKAFGLMLAACLIFGSAGVRASVITTGCASADTCTLAELYNGGMITVDNVTFSNFALDVDVGSVSPSTSTVTLTGDDSGGLNPGPGVRINGNSAISVNDGSLDSIAYVFTFDVSETGGQSTLQDASLNAVSTTIGDDASWIATARLFAPTVPELLVQQDTIGGVLIADVTSDAFDFAATSSGFSVRMALGIEDFDSTTAGTTSIDRLDFNVSIVPVPAALPLLLSGLGVLTLVSRRRT